MITGRIDTHAHSIDDGGVQYTQRGKDLIDGMMNEWDMIAMDYS